MAETRLPAGGAAGNPNDIFAQASACQWGELTAHVDRELRALIIGIRIDNTCGLEVLVAPGAALDFALRLVGACERLQAEEEGKIDV